MSKVYKDFQGLCKIKDTLFATVKVEERKFPYLSVTSRYINIYKVDDYYWRDLATGEALSVTQLYSLYSAYMANKLLIEGE